MENSPTYNNGNTFLHLKSDRLIFIICILIASLFWLLIKLSEVYSTEYTFKVTYNNVPTELRLTRIVDSTLDLSVTARGFLILKMNLFDDMENLDINLDNYSVEYKGGVLYALYTQELIHTLAEYIGVGEKDIRLSRAMLSFEMEKTSEKRLPIVSDYSLQFVDQYDLYTDVVAEPDYVVVYGPNSVLDTLYQISTSSLILENVMSDQDVIVELDNPSPGLISFGKNDVVLHLKVEKFTESEIDLSINLNNLQYNIKTFPSQAKVYYRVAQIDFNKVTAQQFNVYPVLDNIDIQRAHNIPLRLSKQPDFVRNIRIVPQEVEFLIIK